LDIGIEKVDMHEGITVKALLDSGITGMIMDREMARKYSFKMTKLERSLLGNHSEVITLKLMDSPRS